MFRQGDRYYFISVAGDICISHINLHDPDFWNLYNYGNLFLRYDEAKRYKYRIQTSFLKNKLKLGTLDFSITLTDDENKIREKIMFFRDNNIQWKHIAETLNISETKARYLYSI